MRFASNPPKARVIEGLANLLVIVLVPLLARALYPLLNAPVRGLGLGSLLDALAGNGGFTDIGLEVAGAHGLISRDYTMYDTSVTLDSLLGMGGYDIGPHTHPPMSMVLWLPLTAFEYHWWLSFFAVASFCALALSLRVMRVDAWLAYPLALLICLTPLGAFAVTTTYPLSALFLSLAWTFRARPLVAGVSYAFLAASRGFAALLLVYPLVRRQWRTLFLAVGLVVALMLLALVLEPTAFADFLTRGREAIDMYMRRDYSFTFPSLLVRHGLPQLLVWVVGVAVVGVALARGRELFWALAWLSFAVTSIAWSHSVVAALPLLVVMWKADRLGRVLVLTVAIAALSILPVVGTNANLAWPVMVIASGIALVACRLGEEPVASVAAAAATEPTSPPVG